MPKLELQAEIERWPLTAPFRITGYEFHSIEVLVVALCAEGHIGRGEAAGVHYLSDTPAVMLEQIEQRRATIEAGIGRDALYDLFPRGGARNAIDCALWDLEAKLTGRAAWQIAGLSEPRPLLTTFTCGADMPESMAAAARAYVGARAIKLKLLGDATDAARVLAVRAALPDVWLGVDANRGLTRASLDSLMPTLLQAGVSLIEQPFPIGQEALLDGLHSPIPVAADESVQSRAEMPGLVGRFQVVNIKLDKCGGLTEALAMARLAHELGLEAMVGNMVGTSLGMAPAWLVGQLCQIVDLDGPVFLKEDRATTVQYVDGRIRCPEVLWGSPARGDTV